MTADDFAPKGMAKPQWSGWIALALALAVVFVLGALQLQRTYRRITDEQQSRLQTQAKVVAENLERQLEGVNNALAGVRDEAAEAAMHGVQRVSMLRLRTLAAAMPGVVGIVVLDATGTVLASDKAELVRQNFGARDYFKVPQAGRGYLRLYVSAPFRTTRGNYSINLGKPYPNTDGEFAGIVSANLDPAYFEILARSVLYAPDMHVSVVHGNGRLFIDARHASRRLGADVSAPGTAFGQHLASGQEETLTQVHGPASDADRMLVLRTVSPAALQMDAPLVVLVSRGVSEIYAPWRDDVALYAVLFAVVCASSSATLFLVRQRRQTLMTAQQERQAMAAEHARRLEFGLEGAKLGLWDLNLATDVLTVNARELQMLGYAEGELALDARAWRPLVPREDWDRVNAAFRAHVDVSTEACTTEHRMRHKDGHLIWVASHAMVVERDADRRPTRILGTHHDISERKSAEIALRDTAQRLALAMEAGAMGLIDWHLPSGSLVLNANGYEMMGLAPVGAELDSPHWLRLRHPDDVARADAYLAPLRSGAAASGDCEYRVRHAQGHYVWIHMRAQVYERAENGEAVRIMGAFRDITESVAFAAALQGANEKLARLTVTDGLTGVGNRRLFDQTFQSEWSRCARQGLPLALLMVDIDHFKAYNDRHGHQGGDAVLSQVSALLAGCVQRAGELVARYGGEEFVLLLPGSDLAAADIIATACLAQVARTRIAHGASSVSPYLTLSIGVASVVPTVDGHPADLLKSADQALYTAKHRGRNRAERADAMPV